MISMDKDNNAVKAKEEGGGAGWDLYQHSIVFPFLKVSNTLKSG